MRVLVTGAAGLYGSHLVTRLLKSPNIAHVVALDNCSRGYERPPFTGEEATSPKCTIFRRDYQDLTAGTIDTLQVHVLVHMAASISVDESMVVPEKYLVNNEIGGARLIRELVQTRTRPHLILASSAEVYGDPVYVPIDTDHPKRPTNVYAVTKHAVENHALVANQWNGYPVTIIRNFNTFGPNALPGEYAGVIRQFIGQALRGEPLVVFNGGTQTRDFMYIEDGISAYEQVIARHAALSGQILNIGTGFETSIRDLAEMILAETGSTGGLRYEEGRPADIARLLADISATEMALDWIPQYSLFKGLRETIAWHRELSAEAVEVEAYATPIAG